MFDENADLYDEVLTSMHENSQRGEAKLKPQPTRQPSSSSSTSSHAPPPSSAPRTGSQDSSPLSFASSFSPFNPEAPVPSGNPDYHYVPDDAYEICPSCSREFDWIRRKHHCRYCGGLFCGDCTSFRMLIPRDPPSHDPERVCGQCERMLRSSQDTLRAAYANAERENHIDTGSYLRFANMPYSSTLGSEIRKASYTIHNLLSEQLVKDRSIPLELLENVVGIAFLTVVKGGFIFGGRFGTGLVVARVGGGWSAPSAIGTAGLSWGALIGGEVTDYMILLTSVDAVRTFAGKGQISLGGEVGVSVGPLGRTGSADLHFHKDGFSTAYSYSHSKGLFAGVSLEGAVIFSRDDVNQTFYGKEVTPSEVLFGQVEPPNAGSPLYTSLEDLFHHVRTQNEESRRGFSEETHEDLGSRQYHQSHPSSSSSSSAPPSSENTNDF